MPESPVKFTVTDTTGFYDLEAPTGGWNGISLVVINDDILASARFEHTLFEFAETWQGDMLHHGGAIYMEGPVNVSFSNCSFINNISYLSGAGIYFNGAAPRIEYCFSENNIAEHEPPVEELYGYGGGICGLNNKAVIRENVFLNNYSLVLAVD